jgi:ABC-type sugar transport system ATPase subunit
MSDRIVVMKDGRVAGELRGGASEEDVLTMATGASSADQVAS